MRGFFVAGGFFGRTAVFWKLGGGGRQNFGQFASECGKLGSVFIFCWGEGHDRCLQVQKAKVILKKVSCIKAAYPGFTMFQYIRDTHWLTSTFRVGRVYNLDRQGVKKQHGFNHGSNSRVHTY